MSVIDKKEVTSAGHSEVLLYALGVFLWRRQATFLAKLLNILSTKLIIQTLVIMKGSVLTFNPCLRFASCCFVISVSSCFEFGQWTEREQKRGRNDGENMECSTERSYGPSWSWPETLSPGRRTAVPRRSEGKRQHRTCEASEVQVQEKLYRHSKRYSLFFQLPSFDLLEVS